MLVDLYKAGEMPGIIVDSNAGLGTYDGINQNKYVSTLDGPWSFAIFAGAYKNTQLDGSLIPAGPGGSVSVVGGEDIVMTKASKNKTAARSSCATCSGRPRRRRWREPARCR